MPYCCITDAEVNIGVTKMKDEFVADERFEKHAGNKYLLVNVAAFRARQINDGVEVYVKSRSNHSLQIALEEIAEGYIKYDVGVGEPEPEEIKAEESVFQFDDIVDLEGGLDLEDETMFDFEDIDFDEEFEDA